MKKKKNVIIVVSIIIVLAAVCGAVFGVKYYNQKKLDEKLNNGTSLIEAYMEKFETSETKNDKSVVYNDFIKDSELKDIIDTCATEEWNANYTKSKDTMYNWFITYYNDGIQSVVDNFESTEKTISDCEKVSTDLNSLKEELDSEAILTKEDISTISEKITENINNANNTIEEIKTSYTDKYNSYLVEDIDSASKSDLNTAIENLTSLSEEVSEISETHFSELIESITNTISEYNSKVEKIEEEEAAAAAERAKKEAAAQTSSNTETSTSTSNTTSTSTSSSSSKYGDQSSWSITANFYVDEDGCCVTFNAPQVIYDAANSGKEWDWVAWGEINQCAWGCGVGTVWFCDRNGNIIRSEAA